VTPSIDIGRHKRFGESFPFVFKVEAACSIKTHLYADKILRCYMYEGHNMNVYLNAFNYSSYR
jgi:hypothetical protein